MGHATRRGSWCAIRLDESIVPILYAHAQELLPPQMMVGRLRTMSVRGETMQQSGARPMTEARRRTGE